MTINPKSLTFSHSTGTCSIIMSIRMVTRRRQHFGEPAVRSVEIRMLSGMTQDEQSSAFRILQSMIHSLRKAEEDA